ncbi:MAG: ketoacyl-ACP synthase III [Planctomycetes bacterium]|nr:ketoacyl-ACP synthase III [Planctomycetota bacterium]MCB9917648.1 ketoacyl-ACP synthase III [Planctomycetota bacterium]
MSQQTQPIATLEIPQRPCPVDLRILGIGGALPGRDLQGAVLSNARLTELMEDARVQLQGRGARCDFAASSPDFPERRIGISQRHVLDERLTARDLAIVAARRALENAEIDVSRVRAIIVSSVTQERVVPAIATSVQSALGLPVHAAAFDLSLGCTGFVAALDVASGMLAGTEAGSVALVVARSGKRSPAAWTTRGEDGAKIAIESTASQSPPMRFRCRDGRLFVEADEVSARRVTMSGNHVFRDMLRIVPERVAQYMRERDLGIEDIDRFVFHQANARMLDAISSDARLRIPAHKLPSNIADVGNTSSASIPLLLDELSRRGELRLGERLLLVAFGSGYSLAITELRVC